MRFSAVAIEKWRNFVRVSAPLEPRVFVVGPNASGKSNLLDVFRFLHDVASAGGGFRSSVERRGGVSSIRSLASRGSSNIVVEVSVSGGVEEAVWKYELHFNQDKQSRPVVKREVVAKDGEILLERPTKEDEADSELLTQTHLEQVNANREFRELVDFFTSTQYLHIVPQLVRDPDRSRGYQNDPFGGDFLEQVASTRLQTQKARLRRITEALKVAVPQLSEIELKPDAGGTPHLRGRYEHWRPYGAWQTEEQFSDGTLRLMGLLWATLSGKGTLLLEEPELSLHPEIIRHLAQMFARAQRKTGRQIMLSTHSPDLLRDEGIGLDEVLLLVPEKEGTSLRVAKDIFEVQALLQGGMSLADVVLPMTRPKNADQLALFVDA